MDVRRYGTFEKPAIRKTIGAELRQLKRGDGSLAEETN